MAKIDLQKFKKNAKSALSKKETHGIFKEHREKFETLPLDALLKEGSLRLDPTPPEALKRSIETVGQLEPIVVVQEGETYRVLDGHRRVAVAEALGHVDIAAEVVEVDEREALFLPYLLNAPESFDVVERALFLRRLRTDAEVSDEEIREKCGLDPETYKELFFEPGDDPIAGFNTHFEGLLKRYFRIVRGELDIEKNGIRLRLEVDPARADERTKAEVYRFIHRLGQL